jgi:hypothetical protein
VETIGHPAHMKTKLSSIPSLARLKKIWSRMRGERVSGTEGLGSPSDSGNDRASSSLENQTVINSITGASEKKLACEASA